MLMGLILLFKENNFQFVSQTKTQIRAWYKRQPESESERMDFHVNGLHIEEWTLLPGRLNRHTFPHFPH